ncbi:uncharacterized protein LOC128179833 [Crassostrea angulata]|uniref:uncharacterized protein LOC128179833 n=1 Tax=Magallana angulata TaxID=2784310 RepID=UPI0022B08C7D|nr:uncharacterized protein LOC128179833 [Crassostrea angulata]
MRYAKAFQPKELDVFLSNLPAYSADEIAEIAKQTRGQAGNSIWHNAKNGRITASRFYSVYTKVNTIKRKPDEHVSVSSLLKQIIGGANCSDDTKPCPKAIKHGQAMEPAESSIT